MRVYFHLVRGSEILRDEEGIDVADLDQARTEALRSLEEMRQEDPAISTDWTGWTLEISDASGAVLLSIDLNAIGP